MKRFYVSLVRGLLGYYVLFEAPDEMTVRKHVAEYFGRMWCEVYTEEYFKNRLVGKYPISVINYDRPIVLDNWQWE